MPSIHLSSRRARAVLTLGAALLAGAAGCGYSTYEQRLDHSKRYYAYLEKVEMDLAPKWLDGRNILDIRVPKQFQPIPAPQPIKREDGELEMPTVDPRQPDYLNLTFPELLGAWEAPLEVTVGSDRETRRAYIYAMSNYWLFIGDDPAATQGFTKTVTETIGAALEQSPKEEPAELHPKPGGYLPSGSYEVFSFQPKPITQRTADRESTVNYYFWVYSKRHGDVQAVIVVALPEGIDPREKINERVTGAVAMLDYVNITRTPPRPGTNKAGPAQAAPAATF